MSAFRSDDESKRAYADGVTGAGHPADPIARNPKDLDRPGGAIEAAGVGRSSGILTPVIATPVSPVQPWGMSPHGQAVPSPGELLVSILRFKWTILAIFILVSSI